MMKIRLGIIVRVLKLFMRFILAMICMKWRLILKEMLQAGSSIILPFRQAETGN
jgi:hypothetical protein